MKKIYKMMQKTLVLAGVLLMASCSQDLSYQEAMSRNQRKIGDSEKLDDANFLVEAKSNGILQVRLTELAATTGYASSIVNAARKQLEELNDLTGDLDDLARREQIAVPDQMDDQDQAHFFEVSKADREDFDRNFLQQLKLVNDDNIQRYMNMATDARDADVRAFAARKLDVFRNHVAELEKVEKDLLNTY